MRVANNWDKIAAEREDVIRLLEPYREALEDRLVDYNEEDHGSWRDYRPYVWDLVPDDVYDAVSELLKEAK